MEEEREHLVKEIERTRAETLNRGPDHGRVWKLKWVAFKMAEKELVRYDEEKERRTWFYKNWPFQIEVDQDTHWNSKVLCQFCEKVFKLKTYRRGEDDLIYCGYHNCEGNAADFRILTKDDTWY